MTIRVELAEQSVRVAGLHVRLHGYGSRFQWTGPKADPAEIATIALDWIEAGLYEIPTVICDMGAMRLF